MALIIDADYLIFRMAFANTLFLVGPFLGVSGLTDSLDHREYEELGVWECTFAEYGL